MGRKSKVLGLVKIEVVEKYLNGEDSINHISKELGVNSIAVLQWVRIYQSLGANSLLETSKNSIYTEELKASAVKDYLSGNYSLSDVSKKYGIKSRTQVSQWILKDNSHEELKSSGTGGVPIMTKGRKTTYEERIEIVKYCIEHQTNYSETAQHFQVSYQQVYSWITKYETME